MDVGQQRKNSQHKVEARDWDPHPETMVDPEQPPEGKSASLQGDHGQVWGGRSVCLDTAGRK